MQLPTLKKSQEIFSTLNKNFGGMKFVKTINITAAIFTGLLICNEGLAEPLRFPVAEDSPKFGDIARANLHNVELPLSGKSNFLHQLDSDWIGNRVEFLASVSVHSQPMADVSTKCKGNNCPDERDESGVCVEQKNELTPEGIHKFRQILLGLLLGTLTAAPLCMYFSMVISPRLREKSRRRRRYHTIKAIRWHRTHGRDEPYREPRKTLCQWFWI
ncbi:hypothetical protein P831_04305 [Klebsiella aerogenes UCI 28]|nr:hypothetical protein P848_02560 [Klebsiella aerogenes UCI 45]EUL75729.1 hypothetical protein P831_04305 [Klebsiella aerogenes UCI 28]EUL83265.1 hypothetical protein P830_02280 [Klebsiella aerogenes UCI 27]